MRTDISKLHPSVVENAVRMAWRAGVTNNREWGCPCCMFQTLHLNSDLIRAHIMSDKCGVLTDSLPE